MEYKTRSVPLPPDPLPKPEPPLVNAMTFVPIVEASVPVAVMLPTTDKASAAVVVPIPTFPFVSIVKSEVPDEEATLNGFTADEPCTLNVYEDEVAFTPANVPLSRSSPVESVVGELNLATYPLVPPVTPEAVIPRDDVAIH